MNENLIFDDILIIDDEPDNRLLIEGILRDEGYTTRSAATAEAALESMVAKRPKLVLLDIWLEGSKMDGMDVLRLIRDETPDTPVIMISGHGNIETAVSAIKLGATDFIEKPFKAARVLMAVSRALESARLRQQVTQFKKNHTTEELLGSSQAMVALRQAVDKVAATNSRVLITGPAGVGKELVARRLHDGSARSAQAFVVVNCSTLDPDQTDSELFGVEASLNLADTGRVLGKTGLFENAAGGTLLLAEVADLPLKTQAKLVRVLMDQSFEKVGGRSKIVLDARVVASTSKDLNVEMAAGRFREDLFYRLSVVPIRVPSLRERREDIPELLRFFMARAAAEHGLAARLFDETALAALQAYHWPGNVRQIKNVVDWCLIMAPGTARDAVGVDHLPADITRNTPSMLQWEKGNTIMGLSIREAREMFEREYLLAQINRFSGNISRTAQFIGMERSALHRKLKSLGAVLNDNVEREPYPPLAANEDA